MDEEKKELNSQYSQVDPVEDLTDEINNETNNDVKEESSVVLEPVPAAAETITDTQNLNEVNNVNLSENVDSMTANPVEIPSVQDDESVSPVAETVVSQPVIAPVEASSVPTNVEAMPATTNTTASTEVSDQPVQELPIEKTVDDGSKKKKSILPILLVVIILILLVVVVVFVLKPFGKKDNTTEKKEENVVEQPVSKSAIDNSSADNVASAYVKAMEEKDSSTLVGLMYPDEVSKMDAALSSFDEYGNTTTESLYQLTMSVYNKATYTKTNVTDGTSDDVLEEQDSYDTYGVNAKITAVKIYEYSVAYESSTGNSTGTEKISIVQIDSKWYLSSVSSEY